MSSQESVNFVKIGQDVYIAAREANEFLHALSVFLHRYASNSTQ